ncbi:helicase associated domain-containing protein, partial [Streptomyces sp. NPDC005122]
MVPGVGDRMAAQLPARPRPRQRPAPGHGRGTGRTGRGPRSLDPRAAGRVGTADARTAAPAGIDRYQGAGRREAVEPVRRTQDDRWAANLVAAHQFHTREGHLRVPRKTVEDVAGEQIKLGAFLDNARRRAAKLREQRRAELDDLGMHRELVRLVNGCGGHCPAGARRLPADARPPLEAPIPRGALLSRPDHLGGTG